MSKPREFDLKQAAEIALCYSQKDSTIDNGNLFFALLEYRDAFSQAMQLLEKCERTFAVIDDNDREDQIMGRLREIEAFKKEVNHG